MRDPKLEEMGLIWMSAGNSYFSEKVIERLIKFAIDKYEKVIVMAPDEPAIHTYLAMGYKENKATRKAKLNANLLQNRAKRVIDKLNTDGKNFDVSVVEWQDEILPNRDYLEKYSKILSLFKKNKEFRKDAEEVTLNVLEGKLKKIPEIAIKEAVHYLLKELAFIHSSLKIFDVKSVTYIYHKDWPIYKKYISGEYDGKKKPDLKFRLKK